MQKKKKKFLIVKLFFLSDGILTLFFKKFDSVLRVKATVFLSHAKYFEVRVIYNKSSNTINNRS